MYGMARSFMQLSLDERRILDITDQDIRALCDRLNDTPRKCLEHRTPEEIFLQHVLAIGT